MNLLTDSYFGQGFTHQVCEDYALHGGDESGCPYTILSDGCSNDGKRIHTDFGSRILAKAAEEHIEKIHNPDNFMQSVGATARTQVRAFPNLPDECLTATLMTLRITCDVFKTFMIGDGIVGGRRKDGRWKVYVVDYPKSAPYYLKYNMFGETANWAEQFGGKYKLHTFFGRFDNPFPLDWENGEPPTAHQRLESWGQKISITTTERDFSVIKPYNSFEFPLEEYDLAFIASDGPESFWLPVKTAKKKYNEPLHVLDVLSVLLDFVDFRPGFVSHQCNWAFRQDRPGTFKRRNWINGDDVSLGAMYFGQ